MKKVIMNKLVTIGLIIVIIAGVLAFYFVGYKYIIGKSQAIPYGKFVKISNVDYAPKGKILIVEQSWIGCPVGAAASWVIYNVLFHYGNLSYYEHYSDPFDKAASNVPGLIFTGFKPSGVVEYEVVYTYNEYLNATPSGQPIPVNQLIPVGEQVLYAQLPQNIAALMIKYETQVPLINYNNASALVVKPPHLNFGLLITGPNGTYVLTGALVSPKLLEGYTPQYVMSHLDSFSAIVNESNYIESYILYAAGPLASQCIY
ncbi:hypothetical protein HS7_04380 [Sulfolobales archaeon HS-7]|nr:hypothetical protein HS7_04380 [Sulfolobales archaeon HS-7]